MSKTLVTERVEPRGVFGHYRSDTRPVDLVEESPTPDRTSKTTCPFPRRNAPRGPLLPPGPKCMCGCEGELSQEAEETRKGPRMGQKEEEKGRKGQGVREVVEVPGTGWNRLVGSNKLIVPAATRP